MQRLLTLICTLTLGGCAMFLTAQAIPAPGGCDQCHKVAISNHWEASLTVASLNDELGGHNWQKPESMLPDPKSPLEQQKVTESRCFRCHKSPDELHRNYSGRYHHQ